eukprot:6190984-Pleurochrysis_carterae.AAC.1
MIVKTYPAESLILESCRLRGRIRGLHSDSAEGHASIAYKTSLQLPSHPPMYHGQGLADVLSVATILRLLLTQLGEG